ncbi:hypothetical protein [Actinomadura sp. CNU-125]|uniref:hypothetical protein n=1 Tax=Actinomadura sp. CNU-125 TaxID=1904961 RepID=UPI001177DA1F|nr:hypothetical protein [Actinomadura sp. CNU-125]
MTNHPQTSTCPECSAAKDPTHRMCGPCWRANGGGNNRGDFFFLDGPPRRGISDLVAVALVMLRLDTVRRTTLTALLPQTGQHHQTGNHIPRGKIRTAVRGSLRRFEHNGWIVRDGHLVHVRDRARSSPGSNGARTTPTSAPSVSYASGTPRSTRCGARRRAKHSRPVPRIGTPRCGGWNSSRCSGSWRPRRRRPCTGVSGSLRGGGCCDDPDRRPELS